MLYSSPSFPAEMYNDAAEGAIAAMKGRLSTKYYMLSEECYGEVEEWGGPMTGLITQRSRRVFTLQSHCMQSS